MDGNLKKPGSNGVYIKAALYKNGTELKQRWIKTVLYQNNAISKQRCFKTALNQNRTVLNITELTVQKALEGTEGLSSP